MSNLINNFPSKLTAVVRSVVKNGHRYTAHFEDGTQGVIRTSGRVYASVAQCGTLGGRTDFLFGSKAQPSLRSWEKERHIVTVPITTTPVNLTSPENRGRTGFTDIKP